MSKTDFLRQPLVATIWGVIIFTLSVMFIHNSWGLIPSLIGFWGISHGIVWLEYRVGEHYRKKR
jgi:hypothetical protein